MAKAAGEGLLEVAGSCVRLARRRGAAEAAARAYRVREVSVQWRDGAIEKINEATTRGVSVQLYVDGRYATVFSSDLRPEALPPFIQDSLAMARSLEPDPYRSLPDPRLYAGQARVDLRLSDPGYAQVTPALRRRRARELEEAARAVPGAAAIQSVTTGFTDTRAEVARVHSNGFSGEREETSFWMTAEVTVRDADGRRPAEWAEAGGRFAVDLPKAREVGRLAAERALLRLGSGKGESAVLPMAVEARAAGRLLGFLLGPLQAQELQQKRSFLEGRLGERIGSRLLTLTDEPLLPKGLGSRLFDGEGLAARPMTVVEEGVLRAFYVDTYYGKKLGLAPTTGSTSNVVLTPGAAPAQKLLTEMGEGVLVTGFLGGNANGTTGDYSLGVQGFRVRGGRPAEPVAEMNVSGNLADLMERLAAVGDDPYPYSTMLCPTLVFDAVQFAGV